MARAGREASSNHRRTEENEDRNTPGGVAHPSGVHRLVSKPSFVREGQTGRRAQVSAMTFLLPMAVYFYYFRKYSAKRPFWSWYAESFVVGVIANISYGWALKW